VGAWVGDDAPGFRLVYDGIGHERAVERGMLVDVDKPGPSPLSAAPFHLLLGLDQQISGRLGIVDDSAGRLRAGPVRPSYTFERGGVKAIVQRQGETQS